MAVTTLNALSVSANDTWPATFAVSTGSNRLAFIATCVAGTTDAAPPTSVSLGGQSMSKVVEADDSVNNRDVAVTVWVLDEAGIAAMSGSDVVISGGGGEGKVGFTWSVQDAAQTISQTSNLAKGSTSGTQESLSLSRTADGMSFAAVALDFGDDPAGASSNPALGLATNIRMGSTGYASAGAGVQSEATTQTGDFTWTPTASRDSATVAFSVEPAATGPTITTPATISPGETITFTATGFSGVNSVTATDGASTMTLTNIVNTTGDTYTADVPAFPAVGASQQMAAFGSVTMEVGDGTDTATDTTTLQVASGYSLTALGATFSTDENSYLFGFGGTPATSDQFFENSPNLVLGDEGDYIADTADTYVITGLDITDGIAQTYELIVGPAAAAIGRITRRALTSRNITRRSLTARP